jgi:hypothetical protein
MEPYGTLTVYSYTEVYMLHTDRWETRRKVRAVYRDITRAVAQGIVNTHHSHMETRALNNTQFSFVIVEDLRYDTSQI